MNFRRCASVTLLVLICTALSSAALAAPTQGSPPRSIIFFGDSITAGGALPGNQRQRLWLTTLEKSFSGQLKLINEGKGGRPTDSFAEFEAMLQRQPKPDALAIALGMNDSRDITEACIPKATANIGKMIEKARQTCGTSLPILLIGPTNINQSALGPTKPIGEQRERQLQLLNEAFAKLASETGSQFVSLFGTVPDSALLKDGVHPDADGNDAIAKALEPALKQWLD